MNIFFRVLLAVYAFFLTIVSFVAILATLKPELFNWISSYFSDIVLTGRLSRFVMFIISVIFFALSITFLFSGVRSNKDKKSISKYTNIGEIRISLNSIESIALNAARKLGGVRESKANVVKMDDSVSISLKIIVLPDTNIPAISEDIQVRVKGSVEESTGIKVSDVRVVVENISAGYKSRVE